MIYWVDIGVYAEHTHTPLKELHSVIGKGMLKYYLTTNGYPVDRLAYTKYGKPYFSGLRNGCSVSHSHHIVSVAITRGCIGLDIQYKQNIGPVLMKRFFTASEQDYVGSRETDKRNRFYQIWCAKEAVVKYLGLRLAESIKDIQIQQRDNQFVGLYQGKCFPLSEINIDDDYEVMACHHDELTSRCLKLTDIIDYCEFKEGFV